MMRGLGPGWVVLGLWATFGCAGQPIGDAVGGSESGGDGDSSSSSGTTTTADVGSAGVEESTIESGADPTTNGETTAYPTHESCDDSGAGYDVPDLDGGDESGSADDESSAGMAGDIPIGATVFEVRQNQIPAGTLVEVADLLITSPVAMRSRGDAIVFAQSPAGGMYSAISLVLTDLELAESIMIGDVVRVRARVGERYVFTALFVEPGELGVLVEDTAEVPAAIVLAPADLAPGSATAEAYESALVRVENPEVEPSDGCIGEFTIDAGLRVDDLFLGDAAPSPDAGDVFAAVTGPLRYTYNGFEIAPRTPDDIEP